jgi:hypothetical protein
LGGLAVIKLELIEMADAYRVDCGPYEYSAKALVIRKGYDRARSNETIENFVSMFIHLKKLLPNPNTVLEIETRPGVFVWKKPLPDSTTGRKWFNSDMLINSKRQHLILGIDINIGTVPNSDDPYMKFHAEQVALLQNRIVSPHPDSEFKEGFAYRFEPGVTKDFFFSRLNYFLKLAKAGSSKLKEASPVFTIDLTHKDRSIPRQTIDLTNRRFYSTEKRYKSTIDILYNCVQYRMAGAIEIDTELSRDSVKTQVMNANSMRVKVRRVFILFETIEVTFTRVFQLEQSHTDIKGLIKVALDKEETFDPELLQSHLLSAISATPNIKVIHEFEMEYLNTQDLMNAHKEFTHATEMNSEFHPLLKKSYYLSKIRSLLYNSECLYSGFDAVNAENLKFDELHMRDYIKCFTAHGLAPHDIIYPCIGTYLDKVIYDSFYHAALATQSHPAIQSHEIVAENSSKSLLTSGIIDENTQEMRPSAKDNGNHRSAEPSGHTTTKQPTGTDPRTSLGKRTHG